MDEPESLGMAKAKRIGHAFAFAGLLAGGLGLFAGGFLEIIGTIVAVCCIGGVCAAKMAEQLEDHRDRLIESWEPPAVAEPATLSISQEVSVTMPEKNWVASLDTPRANVRTR